MVVILQPLIYSRCGLCSSALRVLDASTSFYGVATMPSRRPLSVSSQVVLALLLGALVGLFFGERIAFLQDVGKAFILLLQMTVLPYIVLSLMTGLGNLSYQQVKTLALRVGTLLVISWGLAFVVILLMPLAFPTWESASFFSTSLIEKHE